MQSALTTQLPAPSPLECPLLGGLGALVTEEGTGLRLSGEGSRKHLYSTVPSGMWSWGPSRWRGTKRAGSLTVSLRIQALLGAGHQACSSDTRPSGPRVLLLGLPEPDLHFTSPFQEA